MFHSIKWAGPQASILVRNAFRAVASPHVPLQP
jgi:hypothetical protein